MADSAPREAPKAMVMITDFSTVAFDFAYLKKPLIYYQFDNNYHFDVESGYFDYDEMGFGPVAKTSEELRNDIGVVFLVYGKGFILFDRL